ncbi:hypothetical protein Tco_1335847 [Tanacetum coccineum]
MDDESGKFNKRFSGMEPKIGSLEGVLNGNEWLRTEEFDKFVEEFEGRKGGEMGLDEIGHLRRGWLRRRLRNLRRKLHGRLLAKMQPMYSCLYAKADTFMDNMMDRVRIYCDKKPRCLNVHCHELATPSQPFP